MAIGVNSTSPNTLEAYTKARYNMFASRLDAAGYTYDIASTYRDGAYQNMLRARGRGGNPGKTVTNAGAGESKHNTGQAVDLTNVKLKGVLIKSRAQWEEIAKIAKECGLNWGGTFKNLYDPNHFESPKPLDKSSGGIAGSESGQQATISDVYDVGEPDELVLGSVLSSDMVDTEAQLVIDTNLDNPPWWKEGLVGNPHLKRIPTPVTFKILLSELSPSEYLPNRPAGADPLEIRLNCSLSQISQKMRHVINKSNSRSGYHLTFWGMEPDMISGSGSTGAFMNSFGLTDLMSLEGTVDKLGFGEQVDNAGGDDNALMRKAIQNTDPTKRLRVAAQDAFIELLSLFKNNGVVRFKTENYSDAFDSRAQLDKAVWSTQYGASTYERKARNNDIMARGGVVMTYKGNTFQGYFKSFNWTMDADNPFQWKFDFTFQVQRTVHLVYYKNATS